MSSIVLDCSVTVSWFMSDESSALLFRLLDQVANEGAIVPPIWQLEVGNVLLIAQRKRRITREQRLSALYALKELPITVDHNTSNYVWIQTTELAERYDLTLYDACYLELSLRYTLPLATFDNHLKQAANLAGVTLVI